MQTGNSYQSNNGFVFEVEDDNLSCNSNDVIYVLRCRTCGAEYIGETKNIRKRIHTHSSNTG